MMKFDSKKRDKRNLQIAKKAAKMTGNESLVCGANHEEIAGKINNVEMLRPAEMEALAQEDFGMAIEFLMLQTKAEALVESKEETKAKEKKQKKGKTAFYMHKLHIKRILERTKDNLTPEQQNDLEEMLVSGELEPDDVQDLLTARKRGKGKSTRGVVEKIETEKVRRRLAKLAKNISNYAQHAKLAPGDQAGGFDKEQAKLERALKGEGSLMTLEFDGNFDSLSQDISMKGQMASISERSQEAELGNLESDAPFCDKLLKSKGGPDKGGGGLGL